MKKQLLGTTALVAAGFLAAQAGPASAQGTPAATPLTVTINGFIAQFVGWTNQFNRGPGNNIGPSTMNPSYNAATGNNSATPHRLDETSDARLVFRVDSRLANGITTGGRVELTGGTSSGLSGDQIRQVYGFLRGDFGELRLGSATNVANDMILREPDSWRRGGTFINGGTVERFYINPMGSPQSRSTITSTSPDAFETNSEKIVYYTPRMAGIQVGYSYTPEFSQDRNGAMPHENGPRATFQRAHHFGINHIANYGGVDVLAAVAYGFWKTPEELRPESVRDDPSVFLAGGSLGYAGFKVGASYAAIRNARTVNVQNGSNNNPGAGASGATGISTTTAAFNNAARMQGSSFGLGISYTLGPATVSANYVNGKNNDCTIAGTDGVPVASISTCSGYDRFTGYAVGGSYLLGPGVSIDAQIFHARLRGNNNGSTAPDFNYDTQRNVATGLVTGLVLTF